MLQSQEAQGREELGACREMIDVGWTNHQGSSKCPRTPLPKPEGMNVGVKWCAAKIPVYDLTLFKCFTPKLLPSFESGMIFPSLLCVCVGPEVIF